MKERIRRRRQDTYDRIKKKERHKMTEGSCERRRRETICEREKGREEIRDKGYEIKEERG